MQTKLAIEEYRWLNGQLNDRLPALCTSYKHVHSFVMVSSMINFRSCSAAGFTIAFSSQIFYWLSFDSVLHSARPLPLPWKLTDDFLSIFCWMKVAIWLTCSLMDEIWQFNIISQLPDFIQFALFRRTKCVVEMCVWLMAIRFEILEFAQVHNASPSPSLSDADQQIYCRWMSTMLSDTFCVYIWTCEKRRNKRAKSGKWKKKKWMENENGILSQSNIYCINSTSEQTQREDIVSRHLLIKSEAFSSNRLFVWRCPFAMPLLWLWIDVCRFSFDSYRIVLHKVFEVPTERVQRVHWFGEDDEKKLKWNHS